MSARRSAEQSGTGSGAHAEYRRRDVAVPELRRHLVERDDPGHRTARGELRRLVLRQSRRHARQWVAGTAAVRFRVARLVAVVRHLSAGDAESEESAAERLRRAAGHREGRLPRSSASETARTSRPIRSVVFHQIPRQAPRSHPRLLRRRRRSAMIGELGAPTCYMLPKLWRAKPQRTVTWAGTRPRSARSSPR